MAYIPRLALKPARRHHFAVLLAASLAGCGSSSNEPADAGAPRDAAATGDAGDAAGAADADDAGGADAAFVPPVGTRRLVAGQATLVGNGPDSCTNQPGATGDRWCGLFLPSKTAGRSELWMLDATRALTGADVRCDGSDSSCVQIATDVLTAQYTGVSTAGFTGDTLFYRRGPDATIIDGPVWAWRPGWASGRELVDGAGTFCYAPPSRGVAVCLRRNQSVADGEEAEDLFAGSLAAPGDGLLPLVETVGLRAASDPVGDAADFELNFSPDGAYVAWSTIGVPSAKGLVVEKIDDPSTKVMVATEVSNWQISGDGTSWLWLRSYTDNGLEPSGTLETAAFPAGAGVATLATTVADFQVVGPKSVLYRAKVADQVGDLSFVPDLAAPAGSRLLDQDVRRIVTRSADASTVVYTRTSTGVGDDLFAWSASLKQPCTLTPIPSALTNAKLMAADHVVIWAQRDVFSQAVTGAATSLASCATKTFGHDLLQWMPVGDTHLLFVDGAPSGSASGTLRAASFGADGVVGAGTPLGRDVSVVFAALPAAAIYTVAQGTDGDGLYLYTGPLLGASASSGTP
jgi:hypothetical protein